MTTRLRLSSFASALALAAVSCPAHALVSRAWVSGHGINSPACGAVASPCRTLQYAHDNIVAAGGEIDILDPAGYGPLIIRKSLTVANDGVGVSDLEGVTPGGSHIAINAGESDQVNLRGLSLNGGAVAPYGVRFSFGAALTIRDTSIRGFTVAGVYVAAPSPASFILSDVTLSQNERGVFVSPTGTGAVKGVISRSTFNKNTTSGVSVRGGAAASAVATVTLSDSDVSNNAYGVSIGARGVLLARDVTASNNLTAGFFVEGSALLRLAHSVATGSAYGVCLSFGGKAESYGDNNLLGNGASVYGGSLTQVATQ